MSEPHGDWGEIDPFIPMQASTPYPVDALDPAFAAMAREISEVIQVPIDLVVGYLLVIPLACVGNRVKLSVSGEHAEMPGLWFLGIADSSERKSALHSRLAAPITHWENEAEKALRPARDRLNAEKEVAKIDLRKLKRSLENDECEDREVLIKDIERLQKKIDEVVPSCRFVLQDSTPEAFAKAMITQEGSVSFIDDEGAGFFANFGGRYSKDGGSNLDGLLKSYSGNSITLNRVTAGMSNIFLPCTSIALMAQPCVMEDILQRSEFRQRGALGRFIYARPTSMVGDRTFVQRGIDANVSERYSGIIKTLLDESRRHDATHRLTLWLEEPAVGEFDSFSRHIERRLGSGGDLHHFRDFAGRLPGTIVRIAASLALTEAAKDGKLARRIRADHVQRAVRFTDALIDHAQAFLFAVGPDEKTSHANSLLGWIRRSKNCSFRISEASQDLRFTNSAGLTAAAGILVTRNYLRKEESRPAKGPGRKPGPTYIVNPATFDSDSPADNSGKSANPTRGPLADGRAAS